MCDLSWAHLTIGGLGADIAGAVMLALSFSTKRPEQIDEEAPRGVSAETTFDDLKRKRPSLLAESLAQQRAEARVGLVFLVLGFLAQGAPYFVVHGGSLTTTGQHALAGVIVLVVWAVAWVAFKLYVPRDYRRTMSGERGD